MDSSPAAPLRSWEHTGERVSKTQAVLRGLAAGCVLAPVCVHADWSGDVRCSRVPRRPCPQERRKKAAPSRIFTPLLPGEAHSQRPFLGSLISAQWGL